MFRKLMVTGLLGIGAVAGVAATPTTAEAGCCRGRVVYSRSCRHWGGYRCHAPRVIYRPCVVNPCP
jgi:hypothetical protein